MSELSFPWERDAMNNLPMPEGLSLDDQKAYQALASLYGRYRLGLIERAAGSTEKGRILYVWDKEKRMEESSSKLAQWHSRLRREIEGAQCQYRKERTLENADKLSRALDGILEADQI